MKRDCPQLVTAPQAVGPQLDFPFFDTHIHLEFVLEKLKTDYPSLKNRLPKGYQGSLTS
jgi:hypothetical protein